MLIIIVYYFSLDSSTNGLNERLTADKNNQPYIKKKKDHQKWILFFI